MTKLKKEFVYNYNGKNWVILDDFMALKEKLKKTQKEYAKTREQLKEANHIIVSGAAMPRFPVNPELCREYLERWRAK